ncbi:MAG: hypothetical protein IKV27_04670 [Lachnospiraceae bacterium]|nr:hypothetical protein [Lachnospiraceae bacterium]
MGRDIYEQNSLVTYWRKKLNWYMHEATDEEYDEEEILAIKSILDIMEYEELDESYYNPEKGFERFKETLDIRMKIQDEMQRTREKASSGRRVTFRSNGFRKVVMAASLVLTLVIGGTVGAYAQKEGVFSKIKDNTEELQAAVYPLGGAVNSSEIFEELEKIPMKYLNYIWTPTGIQDNVKLNTIEVIQEEAAINIKCKYFDQETRQFVNVTKKTFVDKVAIINSIYDGFEVYMDKQYDSIEVQYLKKINKDFTEYIALFVDKSSMYILNSNCDFRTIENIISQNIEEGNL